MIAHGLNTTNIREKEREEGIEVVDIVSPREKVSPVNARTRNVVCYTCHAHSHRPYFVFSDRRKS